MHLLSPATLVAFGRGPVHHGLGELLEHRKFHELPESQESLSSQERRSPLLGNSCTKVPKVSSARTHARPCRYFAS